MSYYEAMKEYLDEYVPLTTQYNDVRYINHREARKRYTAQSQKFKLKGRLRVAWRESLAKRLKLVDDEIVRATNTIIEMIESSLASGEEVRLANLGDFVLINALEGEKKAPRFRPCQKWLEELNEPQYWDAIGLKRKQSRGRLTRREV